MQFSKLSKKYLYFFHLIGLSVYNPRDSDNSKDCAISFRKSIPALFFGTFVLLNGILSFSRVPSKNVALNDFLHALFILFMIATGFVAFKRSSFLRGDKKYIWKYVIDVEFILDRFRIEVNFEKFSRIYIKKLILMMFFFVCLVIVKFLSRIYSKNIVWQVGALNLSLITLCVNFHTLFYVDFFNFIFESIIHHTLKAIEKCDHEDYIVEVKKINDHKEIVQLLRALKLIHFKMWKIVKLLNSDFGIVLTLLIIQNTNTVIHTVYWLIIDLYKVEDFLAITRSLSMY